RDDEKADLVPGQRQQHAADATTVSGRGIALTLERCHGQTEVAELGPVVLRGLLLTGPDDRLARLVDPVGERHAAVVADPRQHAREGERDAFERVVVVVQDDDSPCSADPAAGSAARSLTRRSEGRGRHARDRTKGSDTLWRPGA